MKKLFLGFLLALVFCAPQLAEAANFNAKTVQLYDAATNDAVTDLAITIGNTVTTKGVRVIDNVGFGTLIVTEDASGGGGDINIYAEYSSEQTTGYDRTCLPPDPMDGTCTQEGYIREGFGNDNERIPFRIRLGEWVRFVIEADATSEVSLKFTYQEDR